MMNAFYDHPVEAPFDHAMIIDFVNPTEGVGAWVSVELDAASTLGLIRAIETASGSKQHHGPGRAAPSDLDP
jgi:hypothetical protein